MEDLYNDRELSDVTLEHRGGNLYLHKVVISTIPYFRKLLFGDMKEKEKDFIACDELNKYSIYLVEKVIKIAYGFTYFESDKVKLNTSDSDSTEDINLSNLKLEFIEVYKIADFLCYEKLLKKIKKKFKENCNNSFVLDLLKKYEKDFYYYVFPNTKKTKSINHSRSDDLKNINGSSLLKFDYNFDYK